MATFVENLCQLLKSLQQKPNDIRYVILDPDSLIERKNYLVMISEKKRIMLGFGI